MKKISIILTITFITTMLQLQAQRLHVGDQIPDIVIEGVINHPEGKVKLSDYKDQLLIIDFIGTYCGSCIYHVNRLDSIRKNIKGFTLLPVIRAETEKGAKLAKRQEWQMPIATGNQDQLFEFFPYKIISHLVWVLNGEVLAITDAKEATGNHIKAFLEGQKLKFPEKYDQLEYRRHEPLLVDGNGGGSNILQYQSAITGNIDGIAGGTTLGKNMIKIINVSPVTLFRRMFAVGENGDWHYRYDNRILIEMNDSLKELINSNEDKKSFCYSLYVPEHVSRDQKINIAREDLNRFFGIQYGIKAQLEKREVECLVLKLENNKKLSSTGGRPESGSDKNVWSMKNNEMSVLTHFLATELKDLPWPVKDGTGFSGKFDISLGDDSSLEQLNAELKEHGLFLEREMAEIEMLVISEI